MNLLGHSKGRLFLFGVLYLCEGAPIGFVWFALPTLLREEGFSLERITALSSLLVLPWVFKFLWAPLVDAMRSSRLGFRAWIVSAQLVMGGTLLPLIWLDPVKQFPAWTWVLFFHALAASTQDVAVDALAIRAVPREEWGRLNGFMQAGMLLGRSLFGGGTIWLASRHGLGVAIGVLVSSIWASAVLLRLVREPDLMEPEGLRSHWRTFSGHLATMIRRSGTWWGLCFALTAAAGFEVAGLLAGPYLADHGASNDQIVGFLGLGAVAAPLVGGLIGGIVSDRWGRRRSVAWFLAGFSLLVLLLAWADRWSPAPSFEVLMVLWVGLYFFIGLFTAASYALFMALTDPSLGATQFSTFMAATNGCEAWAGRVGGGLAERGGYALGFAAMSLVSLASLICLRCLRVGAWTGTRSGGVGNNVTYE